jgi:hypothetical protein
MLAGRTAPCLIVNWPAVAAAGLDRLPRQRHLAPFDTHLAETALADLPRPIRHQLRADRLLLVPSANR